ncbi:MAG: hypothetical protein ACHQIK_18960 [Candidatus Acidiferrales bacterium]
MLRNRFLVLLGVCFLAASAAWADDVGYVDCSSHSEGTQVFGKPRKSNDTVANLACGERFTILVYGFYFSRIQTRDGQVGYVFSNMIALDRGVTSVQQVAPQTPQRPAQAAVQESPSLQMATEKTKIPRTAPFDASANSAAAAQPQSAAPQAQPAPAQPTSTQPAVQPDVTPAPTETSPASAAPASATNVTGTPSAAAQPNPSVPAQPQPEAASPSPTPSPAAAPAPASDTPSSTAKATEPSTAVAEATPPVTPQPDPASAQPEPAAAQPEPAPAPIRPADKVETWEKPRSGGRTAPLMELYGGYAFTRVGGASNGTNLNGAMGSFGWNPKSWLQVVADTSYSIQTVGNTKNVLYGNHFGPRFFYRVRNRWGLTPFVEGLVGGSSERTTISGTGGSTSSTGSALSYKVGGGIDIHPFRHWDIRLFDVDLYRTTFGSGTQQNNYWISTGVVLRLFGGSAE